MYKYIKTGYNKFNKRSDTDSDLDLLDNTQSAPRGRGIKKKTHTIHYSNY